MPIYEYVCPDCGNKFELMRPFSQSGAPADCPVCKRKANRALSRFACRSSNEFGATAPIAGSGGGCANCGGDSCASCHN
jgi:putative FmdB family regulatory protein